MARPEIDPLAVLAALGVVDGNVIGPLSGGLDTALWRIERQGVSSVLRVFRPEQVDTCRREVGAMRVAAQGGIPVPRVHARGVWQDRPALLLSWCPGRQVWAELRDQPWTLWRLGMVLAACRLASIGFGQLRLISTSTPPPGSTGRDRQPSVCTNACASSARTRRRCSTWTFTR